MQEKTLQDSLLEKIEEKINKQLTTESIKKDNIDYLSKLVDMHKDLKNEKYWKAKEEKFNEIRRIWSSHER